MKQKKRQRRLSAAAIAACLWLLTGLIDFSLVRNFKRPVFCVLSAGSAFKDGGSGRYLGLGYSFDIKGNFMPEDKCPGVTEYTARVFHVPVMEGVRD